MIGRMPMLLRLRSAQVIVTSLLIAHIGGAVMSQSSDLCRTAAEQMAAETNVPFEVLWAITQTETGRGSAEGVQPWPWTLNIQGHGHWLATRGAALKQAQDIINGGASNFDVGCFQISYRWHGENFSSLDQMLDPVVSARYAARFLQTLFDETGDWSAAAGAYHSRTPELAARYRRRFNQFYANAISNDNSPAPTARRNTFPLLHSGSGTANMGSLFPGLDGG